MSPKPETTNNTMAQLCPYNKAIALLATHRLQHTYINTWIDFLPPGSITCFVCFQSIAGGSTEYAEHMMVEHFRPLDNMLAQMQDDRQELSFLRQSMENPDMQCSNTNFSDNQNELELVLNGDMRLDRTGFLLTEFNQL